MVIDHFRRKIITETDRQKEANRGWGSQRIGRLRIEKEETMGSTSTSSSYQKRWIGTVGLKNKLGIEIGGRTQVEHIERKKKKKKKQLTFVDGH